MGFGGRPVPFINDNRGLQMADDSAESVAVRSSRLLRRKRLPEQPQPVPPANLRQVIFRKSLAPQRVENPGELRGCLEPLRPRRKLGGRLERTLPRPAPGAPPSHHLFAVSFVEIGPESDRVDSKTLDTPNHHLGEILEGRVGPAAHDLGIHSQPDDTAFLDYELDEVGGNGCAG